MTVSALVESSAGAAAQYRLKGSLGVVLAGWPEYQVVFNLLPFCYDWG